MLSKDKEGIPLVLLEAMVCELPAVGMNVCETGEVVVHEETGLLVRRGSPEELVRRIRYVLVDCVQRENIWG